MEKVPPGGAKPVKEVMPRALFLNQVVKIYLDRFLAISIAVFIVAVALMYGVTVMFPHASAVMGEVLLIVWAMLHWLVHLTLVVGVIGLIAVAVQFFRQKTFNSNRAFMGSFIVAAYAIFLGTGFLQLTWNQYVGDGSSSAAEVADRGKAGTIVSVFESVKSQIDVCNVKSISYKTNPKAVLLGGNGYQMVIELYRQAPSTYSQGGMQSGVASTMLLPATDRSRVVREIDQLKPSCSKEIPIARDPTR